MLSKDVTIKNLETQWDFLVSYLDRQKLDGNPCFIYHGYIFPLNITRLETEGFIVEHYPKDDQFRKVYLIYPKEVELDEAQLLMSKKYSQKLKVKKEQVESSVEDLMRRVIGLDDDDPDPSDEEDPEGEEGSDTSAHQKSKIDEGMGEAFQHQIDNYFGV